MSYTEFHKGKLKKVSELSIEELISFQKENISKVIFEDFFEKIEDGYTFFEGYDKTTRELKYIFHKNILYEVVDHAQEDDTDYLLDVTRLNENELKFNLIFYNGATCFSEMLEEGLDNLWK